MRDVDDVPDRDCDLHRGGRRNGHAGGSGWVDGSGWPVAHDRSRELTGLCGAAKERAVLEGVAAELRRIIGKTAETELRLVARSSARSHLWVGTSF